jgi:hypothetical protein
MTAAERSAAILRKFDASRSRNDTQHAPHCSGGPLVTHQGYSVRITTCQTCGAVETVRNTPSTPRKATDATP